MFKRILNRICQQTIKVNQIDFKYDFEIKNTVRKLIFHLDGEQKMKQLETANEMQTSKIIVGASRK